MSDFPPSDLRVAINLRHETKYFSASVLPSIDSKKVRLESPGRTAMISLPAELFPFLEVGAQNILVVISITQAVPVIEGAGEGRVN